MTLSASATAVDLSRLPPPTIVEQLSYEAILAQMLDRLQELDPSFSALVESDPAMKILQVAAYREMLVRQRVNDAARGVMLAYATGADLDQIAANFEVQRLVVTPPDPVTGAPEVLESDDDLRRRVTLAPEGFSVAGPEGAYVFYALSADGQVLDASAVSPAPGEVLISVLGRAGDGTPDSGLLDLVEAALTPDTVRPLTDQVTVAAAEIVTYDIEADLWTFAGPDPALVLAAAQARVAKYAADSHRLNRDVTRDGIIAALRAEGVQRIALTSPATDIEIGSTEASYCTSISVTHAGVGT